MFRGVLPILRVLIDGPLPNFSFPVIYVLERLHRLRRRPRRFHDFTHVARGATARSRVFRGPHYPSSSQASSLRGPSCPQGPKTALLTSVEGRVWVRRIRPLAPRPHSQGTVTFKSIYLRLGRVRRVECPRPNFSFTPFMSTPLEECAVLCAPAPTSPLHTFKNTPFLTRILGTSRSGCL